MSGDLAAKVLAVIGETERIARTATPSPWRDLQGAVDSPHAPVEAYVAGYADVDLPCIGYTPLRVEDSAHIARNDPAFVLRRCAADRRIADRHRAVLLGGGPFPLGPSVCSWCNHGGEWRDPWPCPDLLDVAEGYGIEVGE